MALPAATKLAITTAFNPKVLKIAGGIILGTVIVIIAPIAMLLGVLQTGANLDWSGIDVSDVYDADLQKFERVMNEIEREVFARKLDVEPIEAQVFYMSMFNGKSIDIPTFVSCFADEETVFENLAKQFGITFSADEKAKLLLLSQKAVESVTVEPRAIHVEIGAMFADDVSEVSDDYFLSPLLDLYWRLCKTSGYGKRNRDTLTEQGKADWSDVLNAKIERIYTGVYGIQADVSGCDAQRLAGFSFMLGGDCSVSDYETWVNPAAKIETSRTETEELAERDFSKRMHKIDGFNRENTWRWLDRAWALSAEVSAANEMPRELAYRAVLDEFADAFTLLDREYAESPAMIYNGKAVFTPQNLRDAVEWLCNGGDLSDAQILAEKGLPIRETDGHGQGIMSCSKECAMKKINVTVSFDEEKINALRMFLSRKNLDLDAEMTTHMERLFSRHVPQNVRNFLELRDCPVSEKPHKKRD